MRGTECNELGCWVVGYTDSQKLHGQELLGFDAQWRKGVNEMADVLKTIYMHHKEYFSGH